MKVQVDLDEDHLIYTNSETISGRVVIESRSSLNISSIKATLSGISVSRLRLGERNETHQLFCQSEDIFPPKSLKKHQRDGTTVGEGKHVFSFCVSFPPVSECYKSTSFQSRKRKRKEMHVLRRLPPSCGEPGAPAEIKYLLKVAIKGEGIPKEQRSITHEITFCPPSKLVPNQHPLQQQVSIKTSNGDSGLPGRLSWQINVELLSGPCLVLQNRIPLAIQITKLRDNQQTVTLKDFQTMVIETTQIRVGDETEHIQRCWIVQTVANMSKNLAQGDEPLGSTVQVPSSIWSTHAVPSKITPTFEICNIKRTYQLEVRLGFDVGYFKPQVVIREFRFPVYILATDAISYDTQPQARYTREHSGSVISMRSGHLSDNEKSDCMWMESTRQS